MLIPAFGGILAQEVNMVHGDTLEIDVCTAPTGILYDDGGPSGVYSDNFDGWVILRGSPGITIELTGNYTTESCCDWLTVTDGNGTVLANGLRGNGLLSVSTASGSLTVQFHSDGSAVYQGFALGWSISGTAAGCTNPVTGLTVTAATTSTLSLAWAAPSTSGPFQVSCNGVTHSGITTNSYTLTGLNPSSRYEITVVDEGAAGNLCCAATTAGRTECASVTLPFSEGFEDFAESSFPPCWVHVENFDDEDYLPQVVSTQASSGHNSLLLSCGSNASSGHFGLVATPPIVGAGSYTIRFFMRASHSDLALEIGVCDSLGDEYDQYNFVLQQTIYITNTEDWQEYTIDWTPATSGQRLALRMRQSMQNGTGRRLYIDDMGVERCGVDMLKAYHIEHDRMMLEWSTYGGPTCSVGLRREGTTADSLTVTAAVSPVEFTGLTPGTRYVLTVYPECDGTPSIARHVRARTSVSPSTASQYCSNFSESDNLPPNWTVLRVRESCGVSFSKEPRAVRISDGCSNADAILVSERLLGLAGMQISATFEGDHNDAFVVLGTLVHADDSLTFEPLDTAYCDGFRHTLTATVPATSAGRHIALRMRNPGWYISVAVQSVASGPCVTETPRVLHRRGSTMVLAWTQDYDTVLVQYGPAGFELGTGTVDTLFHPRRATLHGLTPSTQYDLFAYRPCQVPCEDMRFSARTATEDYPLPYCENFATLTDDAWNYYLGDWLRFNEVDGTPAFTDQYSNYTGRALKLTSWGFAGEYYATAMLPDIEVDSISILNFYAYDFAPQSTLLLGTIPDDGNVNHFRVLDTLHIQAYHQRTHYTYTLRPSDTLFDNRLALRYIHPYPFSNYSCYIDEIHIAHMAYDTMSLIHVGQDSATLSLSGLHGTDSVEVMLVGGGDTISHTYHLPYIDTMGFGGLDSGGFYHCFVRTLDEGCLSYAFSFSLVGGAGYSNCFMFSGIESSELPDEWSVSGHTEVTGDEEMAITGGTALAMHIMYNIEGQTLSFRTRGSAVGDTLLVGLIDGACVHRDSAHFSLDDCQFTPIDTLSLDAGQRFHITTVPAMTSDSVRIVFFAKGHTVYLDDVGIIDCPVVHFATEGNRIICSQDRLMPYYLTIDDVEGLDHRVLFIDRTPYTIEGLRLSTCYTLSWQCLYRQTACVPEDSVCTGDYIPLPYCEDFNVTMGSLAIPPTWTFLKGNPDDEVVLSSWGPSLRIAPRYGSYTYAVMPPFDVDSALSLHVEIYSDYAGTLQIGVIDTTLALNTFIPLWTSQHYGWQYPEVDFTGYTDKRIALRFSSDANIFKIHFYNIPLMKAELLGTNRLRITTPIASPYWLHLQTDGGNNTLMQVTTDTLLLEHTPNTYRHLYLGQATDSTGYSCDNGDYYNIGNKNTLPYCYRPEWNLPTDFNYAPWQQSTMYRTETDGVYSMHFYGYNSQWYAMPELDIDSIQQVTMRVNFRAHSDQDTLVVGVMTDAYDTLTFVAIDTLVYSRSDDGQETGYVDFSSYTGNGRWPAFHYPLHQNNVWFDINEIDFESCPSAMKASATLVRWNQVRIDSPSTPFYVEYYPALTSYQGQAGNSIIRVDSVPLTLTLQSEVQYNFHFRCDSAASSCLPPKSITTLEAPLDPPACFDFDTLNTGAVPRNWTIRNIGIGASETYAHSGTHSIMMPVATNSYLITPDIDSVQNITLSLWFRAEDISDRLVVGVMTDPNDQSSFYPVRTLAPTNTGSWEKQMVAFDNAPADANFIALRARSNRPSGDRAIYVDDMFFSLCAALDFRVQSLTNNTVTLTWKQVGSPDITISVIDNGTELATYTHVTPPLELSSLTMLHYYTFLFNSACSDNGAGFCTTDYSDSLSIVAPAPGVGCVNPTDLTSPQAVFFSGTYNSPYSHAGAIDYGTQNPESRHTICYDTAQRDPRTRNQLRTIPEGYTSSVRLGNWGSNSYSPEAEGVIYSLYVDTSSFELLLLRYAAVLQDPLHAPSDQPRFRMELLDTNYHLIDSACTSADFIADRSLGWNMADDGVLWKDWTAVGIDLTQYAGQQVYFRLTTYDCNEGSHYGYAYFTLECMRKNMNTTSCGIVDSNTLSAPEGFHYRWYSSRSAATISTERQLIVPTEEITYYCDISKLDNPDCYFTISAFAGARYPLALFDTLTLTTNCPYTIQMLNHSAVSNDGINPLPSGEPCESVWWDFGNGQTSTAHSPTVTYDAPGSYTVTLVASIGRGSCTDTLRRVLTLRNTENIPSIEGPNRLCSGALDTLTLVNATTADYNWIGGTRLPVESPCCDDIVTSVLVEDLGGCTITLTDTIRVHPSYELDDSIVFCPGQSYTYRGVDYGGPTSFDAHLLTTRDCDSLVHVYLLPHDTTNSPNPRFSIDGQEWHPRDTTLLGCAPLTLHLRDTSASTRWQWLVWNVDTPDQAAAAEGNEPTFPLDSAGIYSFRLNVESIYGCPDTLYADSILWTFPRPEADFKWSPERPPQHDPQVQLYSQAVPQDADLIWLVSTTPGGGSCDTLFSDRNPLYTWNTPAQPDEYPVSLIALLTYYGPDTLYVVCTDTATYPIEIANLYLQFPNLVSPNGDGVNDTWVVVNLLEESEYSMNELWVYDHWGALVYHVKNIRQASDFWDPNQCNCPDGTYYYRFMAKSQYGIVKRNGIIEVVR